MRGRVMVALTAAAMSQAASAAAENPLIGEWQADGAPPAAVLSYRNVQFGPSAMVLDRAQAIAVRGYDIAPSAVRVRTRAGGDWLFIVDGERICLATVGGLQPLPSAVTATPGERCFARRDPNRT